MRSACGEEWACVGGPQGLLRGRRSSPPATGEYPWEKLDWVWHEDRISTLLSVDDGNPLVGLRMGTLPGQRHWGSCDSLRG